MKLLILMIGSLKISLYKKCLTDYVKFNTQCQQISSLVYIKKKNKFLVSTLNSFVVKKKKTLNSFFFYQASLNSLYACVLWGKGGYYPCTHTHGF